MLRSNHVLFALAFCTLASMSIVAMADEPATDSDQPWVELFNGKDLEGWKASEHPDTFKVVDGELVVKGPRAHLFYVGPFMDANFKNFHWRCEIMTKPKANSGMYFHTKYQEKGWPDLGYEAQVNNTHGDPKKTGGLYGVKDVMNNSPVKDGEWFTQEVIVDGKHIVIKVNGEVTTDYTEPDMPERADRKGRVLSSGTVAIQGHDPGSEVHYRKIDIKPLP